MKNILRPKEKILENIEKFQKSPEKSNHNMVQKNNKTIDYFKPLSIIFCFTFEFCFFAGKKK